MTEDLLQRVARLYTPVVGDVIDRMGYRNQIMLPNIRPLFPDAVVVGYALPVLAEKCDEVLPDPYRGEMDAVDALKKDDVMVVDTCGEKIGAYWGELLTTRAMNRGARGAVIDGFTRDCRMIMDMKFPIFIAGISPADSAGRIHVTKYNVPVQCGGVNVNPGDIVFGDFDGVIVIPREIAEEAITRAEEKAEAENKVREELQRGESVSSVWEKYGVL
jgi:4-hydroxy-4-methyl-2-oxoglutarate aldolase